MMLLLRSLPDLSTKDRELHGAFGAKWGRESCIIWGRAPHAEFGPHPHGLSIRAVWGGTQVCHFDGRSVAVDDDNFLIINHGRVCSSTIHATSPVESLTICFQPQLVEQVGEFTENLQPHDGTVSPVIRFIRAHLERGHVDEDWYEEQLLFLLGRMHAHRSRLQSQIDQLALTRATTRREVYRRVGIATDFLHTHYARDIDLGTLAGIACLSKFHFLRQFTLIHGITPRKYLQRKRVEASRHLLESTRLTVGEVAARVGFAHESTLVRQMRRWTNATPRELRRAKPAEISKRCAVFPQSRRDRRDSLLLALHTGNVAGES